jgi:phosphopantetheinyl transferase (holo-ACP synthase)
MVGNDVVDLADPQCLPMGTHPRFDQRVFAPAERRWIRTSLAPARTRWMLWAAKESAYKVVRKLDPTVTFAPVRFVVQPPRLETEVDSPSVSDQQAGAPVAGTVTCAGRRVSFRVVACGDALHVVATSDEDCNSTVLAAVVESGADAPGVEVRRVAADAIAARLGVAADELRIVRPERIPRLQRRGAPLPIDLSLSHHGRFVAFAALMPFRGGGM